METTEVQLKVFDPRGEVQRVAQISASPRVGDLTGKKIGILDNGKLGGETFLPYLEAALKERIAHVELRTWRIYFSQPPDVKDPVLKELAEYGDGVIALMGD